MIRFARWPLRNSHACEWAARRLALSHTDLFAGVREEFVHFASNLAKSGDEKRSIVAEERGADQRRCAFEALLIADQLQQCAGIDPRVRCAARVQPAPRPLA